MKKNMIRFAITMAMLLVIASSASARCYVCMNDLVNGGRGCWYANTVCEDKLWDTYSKERDLKCTPALIFSSTDYVTYNKPTGHAWVVSGDTWTPIIGKNNIVQMLTKNDPGQISMDELNVFIEGTTLKIVETTSTIDKNGKPSPMQLKTREVDATGRPSSDVYGGGGGWTPPVWIDPALKPMMFLGGGLNMPTGASKSTALLPLGAGVNASAYFPLMGRGFGSKVRRYLTFGLNVGGNYSANVQKLSVGDYKAIDITGQASPPAFHVTGETSSFSGQSYIIDAGPQVNFSVAGFVLSPILNLGYMNISRSSVSVNQTTSFIDTTQAPISIDLYRQTIKGSGLTVIPKLRVAYFLGQSGIGVWAEGAYNYSPNITIETTRFVPNENPFNPGVYDIGLIQEGTQVTARTNFNYNGFSAKVGICFALELSKKHRPWVDCAQEPVSDIFDRWGNLKRSTSVDNVNPNDTISKLSTTYDCICYTEFGKIHVKCPSPDCSVCCGDDQPTPQSYKGGNVNPTDTISELSATITCKCKDKIGTWTATCYSAKDCDECCTFRPCLPFVDTDGTRYAYEGKKGQFVPGKPVEKSLKVDNANPTDTIPKLSYEIKCECKDSIGTWKANCYSTDNCDVCCTFRPCLPFVDTDGTRYAYEGKKGQFMPGKPVDEPLAPNTSRDNVKPKDTARTELIAKVIAVDTKAKTYTVDIDGKPHVIHPKLAKNEKLPEVGYRVRFVRDLGPGKMPHGSCEDCNRICQVGTCMMEGADECICWIPTFPWLPQLGK